MYLKFSTNHECVERYHSDEEYGDWRTVYTFDFDDNVVLTKEQEYDTLPVTDDVKVGDTLYVVYAVWSSGDSFGNGKNSTYDYIGAYKTLEEAQKNAEILKEDGEWSVDITNFDGTVYQYFRSWLGYFEMLEELEVRPVVVVKG